jgi:hypothetical protein
MLPCDPCTKGQRECMSVHEGDIQAIRFWELSRKPNWSSTVALALATMSTRRKQAAPKKVAAAKKPVAPKKKAITTRRVGRKLSKAADPNTEDVYTEAELQEEELQQDQAEKAYAEAAAVAPIDEEEGEGGGQEDPDGGQIFPDYKEASRISYAPVTSDPDQMDALIESVKKRGMLVGTSPAAMAARDARMKDTRGVRPARLNPPPSLKRKAEIDLTAKEPPVKRGPAATPPSDRSEEGFEEIEEPLQRNMFDMAIEIGDPSVPNMHGSPDEYDPGNWYFRRIVPRGANAGRKGARFEVKYYVDIERKIIQPARFGVVLPRRIYNAARQFYQDKNAPTKEELDKNPYSADLPLDPEDEEEGAQIDLLNHLRSIIKHHLWDKLSPEGRKEIWGDFTPTERWWDDNFKSALNFWGDAGEKVSLNIKFDSMGGTDRFTLMSFLTSDTQPQSISPKYLQKNCGLCGTYSINSVYVMERMKKVVGEGGVVTQVPEMIAGYNMSANMMSVYNQTTTNEVGKNLGGGTGVIDYAQEAKDWKQKQGILTPFQLAEMARANRESNEKGKEKVLR